MPHSEHSAREREPGSYAIYKKTGVFPEQTMFYKELQLTLKPAGNPDGSRTEPSGRGYFPGALAGAEVSVKDSKRFAASAGWRRRLRPSPGTGTRSTSRIEAGAAKILIDPFLSDNPSWDNGWSGCLTGKNSTRGGDR